MMLTIGEFARATGLTAKALRIYDDLGLLAPAEVDDRTGYRYYSREQVEPARMVARLRSAGAPLARIARIVDAETGEAAVGELISYGRQLEADIASARSTITTLITQLRGSGISMNTTNTSARSAHRAGKGRRETQLDDLYPKVHRLAAQITGQRLFAVADGFGDGCGAASAAIDALDDLDGVDPATDPLDALDLAVTAAAAAVTGLPDAAGGTTLTALLLLEDRALVAHVGDSRAYLVRDGRLEQLTRDHTVVQSLVDEGRLTDDEARSDPDRALLNRALAKGARSAPDLLVRAVEPGDRFVLTTDGVHAVIERERLAELLQTDGTPDAVAAEVEDAVLGAGAPDNYGVVVVDV